MVEAEDKQSEDRLVTYLRRTPNLEAYRPTGWTVVRTLTVDAAEQAPRSANALTFAQFLAEVRVGFGYAILKGRRYCELGEFIPARAQK